MNVSTQSRERLRIATVLALVAVVLALPVQAQEEEEMPAAGPEAAPEMAAMMEAMERSMALGPQHEELATGVGTWKMTARFWSDPAAEPMVSEGTAERHLELGGRVLEERVTATMMGTEFEGIGRTGYDNVTGTWWSTWTDNMSTGVMVMTGEWDEESQSHVFKGEVSDPMTGTKKPVKMKIRSEGDREVAEMYEPAPDGSMARTMEVVYERQE